MISRQIGATLAVGSGPVFAALSASITAASRSGRNAGEPSARFSSPIAGRDLGAPVEQAEQLAVDRVDAPAQRLEVDAVGGDVDAGMRRAGYLLPLGAAGRRALRGAPAAAAVRRDAEDDADAAVERLQLRVERRPRHLVEHAAG